MPSAIRTVRRFLPRRPARGLPPVLAVLGLLLVPAALAAQERRAPTLSASGT